MLVLRVFCNLLVVASVPLLALLNALTATALVDAARVMSFRPPSARARGPGAPPPPPPPRGIDTIGQERPSSDAILDRNPFDHVTGPLRCPPDALSSPASARCPSFERRIAPRISKSGLHEYVVDRRALDAILEEQPSWTNVKVYPESVDGRVVGVRFHRVKPGSFAALLGIENGDRLETINGVDVASEEAPFEVLRWFSDGGRLVLRLTRGDEPTILFYVLR